VRFETKREIYLDVRPFGGRQVEAIETYLRAASLILDGGAKAKLLKPVVLVCDTGTEIPVTLRERLKEFKASGTRIEIRPLGR
jgi:hypothetical protein